jgi:hypothetical protein
MSDFEFSDDEELQQMEDEIMSQIEIINEEELEEGIQEKEQDLLDPESVFEGIIQNENEEDYIQYIEDKIAKGEMNDYTFILEKLLIKYKQALQNKTFNLTEDVTDKLNKIRTLKNNVEKDFINKDINEYQFTKRYYNLLKTEYDLLMDNEDYSDRSKKLKPEMPMLMEEKLNKLMESEIKTMKKISKAKNLSWPKLEKINKKDSKIIKLKKYLNYYIELEKAINNAKMFIPGYSSKTIYTSARLKNEWVEEIPSSSTLENFYRDYINEQKENPKTLDELEVIRINAIRAFLRDKSKEELLKCISDNNLINKLSYIEKLKLNKIPVMKFREYPETLKKLTEILKDEAKYYKISENDLMKDFVKSFNNPSPNVTLTKYPNKFIPIHAVTIKGKNMRAERTERTEDKQLDIKPSKEGYSFLLKIKPLPETETEAETKGDVIKKKRKNKERYTEKGSVVSLSLKPKYYKKGAKISEGVIDEKYYNIIKPLPDELYEEIKAKNLRNNRTDIVEVYELHIPLEEGTEKLVRRYEDFNDYLTDLLKILETNMLYLENTNNLISADILYNRINKIKEYLETGIDPEYEIDNRYNLEELVKKNEFIIKQREIGIQKLSEYIYLYYPNNNALIENIEESIYNFDNKNYSYNIDKIIFILEEFDRVLENFIESNITIIEILNMEFPKQIPENDLKDYNVNSAETFKYLYNWKPKTDNYDKYKEIILEQKLNRIEFKKLNPELNELEVNQIYFEKYESDQWENSKLKLNKINSQNLPAGKNPQLFMINFLKKERNKLLSRRIFIPATVNERMQIRNNFYRIFKDCNLINNLNEKEIRQLSNITETIIYTYSKKVNDYQIYTEMVENNYKKLCQLITEQETANVPTISTVPTITEFILKEGDLELINVERLNKIIEVFENAEGNIEQKEISKLLLGYLLNLREDELNIYRATLVEKENNLREENDSNSNFIKLIDELINKKKEEKRNYINEIKYNTYIPPIFSSIVPKIYTGNDENQERFYVPNYYIIGENEYLYGGNFPLLYSTIDESRNYTNDEIYDLANLLKIEYKEFDEETQTQEEYINYIYKECMIKLDKTNSTEVNKVYRGDIITEYNPTMVPKRKYTSYINYTYRPRLGVKEPGEVYIVYKDRFEIIYGVPFKYTNEGIPVYSDKFLDPEISKFYYIEGPAVYERTEEINFIYSRFYILVEYKDEYSKVKLFREGVNQRNVKKNPKELFDACNRFTNEIDCNDVNSYGLNKLKCKYIRGRCQSLREEIKKQKIDIDLTRIVFKRKIKMITKSGKYKEVIDFAKTKLFKDALEKANDYISRLIVIKKLNEEQIKQEVEIQKEKLINYYYFLTNLDLKNKTRLELITEDTNFSNVKEFIPQYLIPRETEPLEEKPREEQPGIELKSQEEPLEEELKYNIIRLPVLSQKRRRVNYRQLVVGKSYVIESSKGEITESVFVNSKIENNEIKLEFENGEIYDITKYKFRESQITEIKEEISFKISEDNLNLINNLPEVYSYNIKESEYKLINREKDIEETIKIKTTKDFPYDILYKVSKEKLEQKLESVNDRIITTEMIYETLGKTMYNTYTRDEENFLESLEVFSANLDAKIYAIKHNVDIRKIVTDSYSTINLTDVINEYNKVLPFVKSLTIKLIYQLEYGIKNNDVKLLKQTNKKALKHIENDNNENMIKLINIAENIIEKKEKKPPKPEEEPKEAPKPEETKPEEPKLEETMTYVQQNRRRRRAR